MRTQNVDQHGPEETVMSSDRRCLRSKSTAAATDCDSESAASQRDLLEPFIHVAADSCNSAAQANAYGINEICVDSVDQRRDHDGDHDAAEIYQSSPTVILWKRIMLIALFLAVGFRWAATIIDFKLWVRVHDKCHCNNHFHVACMPIDIDVSTDLCIRN